MSREQSEYAQAGVDPNKIEPFKQIMQAMGQRTMGFPNARQVCVEACDHGSEYWYTGAGNPRWSSLLEGLGNKAVIAEWMREHAETSRTYYEGIGTDVLLMVVNDLITTGAMPVVCFDEVAAGDSDWFADEQRAHALAESFFGTCEEVGMALAGGESPALKYLVNPRPPMPTAPSLSASVVGIIRPGAPRINPRKMCAGTRILGVTSSGIHANGLSLVIERAMELQRGFLTLVPESNVGEGTLGDEALIPTRSYVRLVEWLLRDEIEVYALLPGTGGGVSKIAFDKRPFTYHVHTWPEFPPICRFMLSLGVSMSDCLTTFNCGIGYYLFVPPHSVVPAIEIGRSAGYDIFEIGEVQEGDRKVVFGPKDGLVLRPA